MIRLRRSDPINFSMHYSQIADLNLTLSLQTCQLVDVLHSGRLLSLTHNSSVQQIFMKAIL